MCFVIVKTVLLLAASPFLPVLQKIHLKVAPAKNNVKETRRRLLKNLQEKRSAKLSKRLSTDAQRLDIAKQELQLKRQASERIEEGEKSTRKQFRFLAIQYPDGLTSYVKVLPWSRE